VGSAIFSIVPADRRLAEARFLERVIRGGTHPRFETVRLHKSGRLLDVLLKISGVAGSSDDGSCIMQHSWDITEAKNIERRLLHSRRLESIGKIAAGIIHDVKAPAQYLRHTLTHLRDELAYLPRILHAQRCLLDAIQRGGAVGTAAGELERLLMEAKVQGWTAEIERMISESLDGVQAVGETLQTVGELAHSNMDVTSGCNLNQTIEKALTITRYAWKKVARMSWEPHPSPVDVACPTSEICHVLVNLILNAADALRETNYLSRMATIQIRTRYQHGLAEIAVQDNGPGIPEDIRQEIFEPFFTTKGLGDGTGQGLAIARNIVNTHQGYIRVQSTPGKGATFFVVLPLVQHEESANGESVACLARQ
jgi:two-component system NtrC family sensor kinase